MRAWVFTLLLIASASSRALGQTVEKSADAALIKKAGDAAGKGGEAKDSLGKGSGGKGADPVMDKLFLICKKTGKCDDYLLEKERRKLKEEAAADERAAGSPGDAPTRGTVSGGGGGTPTAAAPPPTPERIEAMRVEAGERARRTMGRATGDAESLRRSLPAGADLEGEGGPGPRSAGPSGRTPDGLDPTNPRTVSEMALAQRTGFSAAFDTLGLKVGAGPRGEPAIQKADGTPATASQLEVLSAVLRAEPVALLRRPDFFDVLSREKLAGLKRDYARPPEARAPAFQDIGMTERGRDFQWSASCSGLSGECNPSAGQGSYRRGQYVSPEDLDRVWAAAHDGAEGGDDFEEYTEEDLRLAAEEDAAAEKSAAAVRRVRGLSSLLARMEESARSWGEHAGLIAAEPFVSSAEGAAGVGPGNGSGRGSAAATGPLRGAPNMPPPVPEEGRAAKRRNWLYGLAAAAGLIALGLRRRA